MLNAQNNALPMHTQRLIETCNANHLYLTHLDESPTTPCDWDSLSQEIHEDGSALVYAFPSIPNEALAEIQQSLTSMGHSSFLQNDRITISMHIEDVPSWQDSISKRDDCVDDDVAIYAQSSTENSPVSSPVKSPHTIKQRRPARSSRSGPVNSASKKKKTLESFIVISDSE